ncbi:MAG: exodeoxyribonuclease VII small subunit [Planctomycetota bacterium]
MAKTGQKQNEKLTYREAAAEIDRILEGIESEEELDIDELAGQVERAAELIRFCSDRLTRAEMRVKTVTGDLAAAAAPAVDEEAGEA